VPALSETDLARIILRVAENQRWDIVNRYSVAYPEGRRGARIERRPMPFGELLQELSDHRRVLESISFDCVSTRGDTLMSVYLSRCGVTKLYAGDFDQFLELFIAPINQQPKDRYAVMDGRSRSHELPAGRPISIEFSAPVLDDRGQLEKLCAVLATIDDSAVCVFHMNPQLHVALVDYADASTMDVCMIGPSKLKIIPGYRTSGASLLRVCDVITGQYAEGAVVA